MNSVKEPQEIIRTEKGKELKIFGDNPAGAYVIGNEVTVNDKTGVTGVFLTGNLKLTVSKGKLVAIKGKSSTVKTRQLFIKK